MKSSKKFASSVLFTLILSALTLAQQAQACGDREIPGGGTVRCPMVAVTCSNLIKDSCEGRVGRENGCVWNGNQNRCQTSGLSRPMNFESDTDPEAAELDL